VIHIHQQHQVQFAGRQPRIGFRSQNRYYVAHMLSRRIRVQPFEHAGLDILGVHNTARSDGPRDAQTVKARSRAHVSNQHPGFKMKSKDGFLRLLFPLAFLPFKPVRPIHAHNWGDVPAGDRMHRLSGRDRLAAGHHHQQPPYAGIAPVHRSAPVPQKTIGNKDALQHFQVAGLVVAALLPFFSATGKVCAAEPTLAILDAGPESAEDAPFVSNDYQFYPGDYLYFRFQVTGFAIQTDEKTEARKISLVYEITPRDANGVPLTPAVSGDIQDQLNPEDKNWTPKRRASFLLPSFIAAGQFRIHLLVKDLIAKSETEREFPFRMGGVTIVPSPSVSIENFRFLRKEDDQQSLDVPAYAPGDTVYARFDMAGYRTSAPDNRYHLTYGLTVFGPDGKPFLEQPNAAELSADGFYAAQFVPGDISLTTTRTSAKGGYVIVLTVRDLVANHTYQTKRSFSLE
jgi:hypothetical protein